nr:copper resistance CopC family protein [Nocardioides caldifontis]
MRVALRPWGRRRFARLTSTLVTIAATGFALVALCVAPASAHTGLESSAPADGARVKGVPTTIQLTFTENISPEFAQVSLTIGEDEPVRLDTAVTGQQVVGTVPDGAAEEERTAWVVGYRVVSADGHPVTGTVEFTAGTRSPSSPSPTPSSTPSPDAATRSADQPSSAPGESASGENSDSLWGLVGALILIPAAVVVLFLAAQRNRSARREP